MSVSQENPLQNHPKYEFVGFLGSGAYGTVVKARSRAPDSNGEKSEVAIKLMPRGRSNLPLPKPSPACTVRVATEEYQAQYCSIAGITSPSTLRTS